MEYKKFIELTKNRNPWIIVYPRIWRQWKSIDRHIIVRFLINTAIQCNKFNIQSFFSYNIKAKQYELYLSLGNISVYNRNCNNVFSY